MSSLIVLIGSVWGMALVLSVPLLAAVYQDSRRGLLRGEEAVSENELAW